MCTAFMKHDQKQKDKVKERRLEVESREPDRTVTVRQTYRHRGTDGQDGPTVACTDSRY